MNKTTGPEMRRAEPSGPGAPGHVASSSADLVLRWIPRVASALSITLVSACQGHGPACFNDATTGTVRLSEERGANTTGAGTSSATTGEAPADTEDTEGESIGPDAGWGGTGGPSPYPVRTCIPLQRGSCPSLGDPCLEDAMDFRFRTHDGCSDIPAVQRIEAGPERDGEACCYEVVVFQAFAGCSIGRPLQGPDGILRAPRLAGGRPRSTAWAEVALAEHASIPAFAKFVLDLTVLGAPMELVSRAHAAMGDELRHFRAAAELAGLDAQVLDFPQVPTGETDLGWLVDDLLQGGCVGETVSAVLAELAAARSTGQAQATLRMIYRDETRHAELAWATLDWLLHHPAHGATARARVEAWLRQPRGFGGGEHPGLARAEVDETAESVCRRVIAPALRAALDQPCRRPAAVTA